MPVLIVIVAALALAAGIDHVLRDRDDEGPT